MSQSHRFSACRALATTTILYLACALATQAAADSEAAESAAKRVSAKVRPEKLRESVSAKLSDAVFKLHELREADGDQIHWHHSVVLLVPLSLAANRDEAASFTGVVPA